MFLVQLCGSSIYDLVDSSVFYGIICVETVSLAVMLNKEQGLKEFFATAREVKK